MYKITKKRFLAENIFLMDVEAPRVAKNCHPGQFVIVRLDEKGERIPLTVCDYDAEAGTVTIVVQMIGASTKMMAEYEEGEYLRDFTGPLGCKSELIDEPVEELKKKKILFVAGGLGTAPVYPQVKWLHGQGVEADCIIGARNKSLIILEEEMKAVAKNVYVATDDGSYGFHGNVNDKIKDLVNNEKKTYDLVIAIGPLIMMKFVSLLTKELGIKTVVSMNPIMVDGTGMCGACRLTVDGKVKFACVDGPEFDGHLVNFDEAIKRAQMYRTEEGRAVLREKEGATHHGGCGHCSD
ncbi:MAG: sulfide/dihydroorotate dehydrogenase-like FAD/NAD-binding protein [Lachnospiraceae bacterium]|nr:sulfide/dihydroorotate dehydrogenase-like FAD/NAD-binding protein [Lachnospiraceae bacterium]